MLENDKLSLHIKDYSVSQTTLDDVFVNFAKQQRNVSMQNDSSNLSKLTGCVVSTDNNFSFICKGEMD